MISEKITVKKHFSKGGLSEPPETPEDGHETVSINPNCKQSVGEIYGKCIMTADMTKDSQYVCESGCKHCNKCT